MNCEQKSGVFLNINCKNPIANSCTNCGKNVCSSHCHSYNSEFLCEDCYWESFIFDDRNRDYGHDFEYSRKRDLFPYDSNENVKEDELDSSNGDPIENELFDEWTESDKDSFDESTGNYSGGSASSEDTFYYS